MVASAIALRVFLFFIPLVLVLVATLGFLASWVSAGDVSRQTGLAGELATQINAALRQSTRARWLALISGLFGLAVAGRTLARTLTIASGRAWRCTTTSPARSTARVAGLLTGMVTGGGMLAIIVNRMGRATGPVLAGSVAVPIAVLAYGAVWLVISSALPRAPVDRTALLPGAAFVGVTLTATQLVLQLFVPSQLSRASQLYGSIGTVIVALSWFFIVARVFVVSFEVDAVVWDRFGSLAGWTMRHARVRAWAEAHPRVRRHLDGAVADDGGRPEKPGFTPAAGDTVSSAPREDRQRTGRDAANAFEERRGE